MSNTSITGIKDNIKVVVDVLTNKPVAAPIPPQFVRRIWLTGNAVANTVVLVPDHANYCIAVGTGAGGTILNRTSAVTNSAATASAGGTFAQTSFTCVPGETLKAMVSNSGINALATSLTRNNGTVILYAPNGNNATYIGGFDGGVVGGNPSISTVIGDITAIGVAGVKQGVPSTGALGGNAGYDITDNDRYHIRGAGASCLTVNSVIAAKRYGAGAAATITPVFSENTGGVLILEFYTYNPNGITL